MGGRREAPMQAQNRLPGETFRRDARRPDYESRRFKVFDPPTGGRSLVLMKAAPFGAPRAAASSRAIRALRLWTAGPRSPGSPGLLPKPGSSTLSLIPLIGPSVTKV